MSLEFPSGPVPLNSPFYTPRPPIEELIYSEISKPGSVVRIRAPRKMGKTSLMLRLLDRAIHYGYYTASLDFQQADEAIFTNIDKFLRWFCVNISRQLKLKPMLDDYWDEEIGSKVSCTLYFQGYLLEQLDSPLVLALNEVNEVFEYPKIAKEFLPLLRSWHEEAKQTEGLQKLRLVAVHSTEVYISLNLNQSPFNVGLPIKLPAFNLEQVRGLAQRHGLNWTTGTEAEQLMTMVGGHPYLVRLALYHLCRGDLKLDRLLREAPTQAGIYSNHLRGYLAILQGHSKLATALQQVVAAGESVELEPLLAYKLESMGLVKLEGDRSLPSCELYRLYFSTQTLETEDVSEQLQKLQTSNRELQRLCNIDELTQLANRRYFNSYLRQEWQLLASEKLPLSLILCDIDFFKDYNDTYGHQAGDNCLQKVANAIQQAVRRSSDLAARYGGEEFIVILPQTDANRALQIAEEIRLRVKALAILHASSRINIRLLSISLGVASTTPNLQSDPDSLVRAADDALYRSKAEGRDRVSVSSTLHLGRSDS